MVESTPEDQLLEAVKKSPAWHPEDETFCDKACLSRYLRARRYQVDKASKMLQASLEWRRSFGVGTLQLSEFDDQISTGKRFVAGHDAEGRPVLLLRKRADTVAPGQLTADVRFMVFTLESACRAMQQGQEKWVWIMDMAGYSRANSPPISVSIETMKIFADHYPERLHKVFMVDAPAIFSLLYSAISPFIDKVTKEKVAFISSKDYAHLEQQLAQGGEMPDAKADPAGFAPYYHLYKMQFEKGPCMELLKGLGW